MTLTAAQALNGQSFLDALIALVVVGLVCYLLWWFIGFIGLPEPFDKVARVVVGLIAVVFLINLLFGLMGHPFIVWR